MARYEVTAPDGKRYEVTAPDGATREQIFSYVQQHAPRPDTGEGFRHALDQGLVFGFADEVKAGAYALGHALGLHDKEAPDASFGDVYNRRVQKLREQEQAYSAAYPTRAIAGELVGALPTLAVGGGALAQAGKLGVKQVAKEGARLGAVYGGIAGAGHTNPGAEATLPQALAERVGGAIESGVWGGALGAGMGVGGHYVGKGVDTVRRAVAQHRTPMRAAGTAFERQLADDGLSAEALLQQLRPAHKNMTPDEVDRVFAIVRDAMTRHGGNARRARADAVRTIAAEMNISPTVASDRLTALTKRYAGKDSPLFLAEYPAVLKHEQALAAAKGKTPVDDTMLTAVEDSATRNLLDYLANAPGKGQQRVRSSVYMRQLGQRDRLHKALVDAVGGDDFDTVAARLTEQLDVLGKQAYKAAFAAQRPVKPALERVIERAYKRLGQRRGVVGEALRKAIAEFEDAVVVQGGTLPANVPNRKIVSIVDDLQKAIDARGVVADMIESAKAAKERSVAAALTQFYGDVTKALRFTNPQWWRANQIWGDARNGQRAMELGSELILRDGPALRETLALFDRMAPAQKDAFRVAVVRRIDDLLRNAGDTHDMTKFFRNATMRDTLRHVFGRKIANALINRIRGEQVVTMAQQSVGNSRTHVRQALKERMDDALDLTAAAQIPSPSGIVQGLLSKASNTLRDVRNRPLAEIATTPMDRPDLVLPLLKQLAQIAQAKNLSPVRDTITRRAVKGGILAHRASAGESD